MAEHGGAKKRVHDGTTANGANNSGAKRHKQAAHTLGLIKGKSAVLGTCEVGRERQATQELLTLLEEAAAGRPQDAASHEAEPACEFCFGCPLDLLKNLQQQSALQ